MLLYTCMESDEMISPFKAAAVSTAMADLPDAVGPHITINIILSPYYSGKDNLIGFNAML